MYTFSRFLTFSRSLGDVADYSCCSAEQYAVVLKQLLSTRWRTPFRSPSIIHACGFLSPQRFMGLCTWPQAMPCVDENTSLQVAQTHHGREPCKQRVLIYALRMTDLGCACSYARCAMGLISVAIGVSRHCPTASSVMIYIAWLNQQL
jgi:hypothetical protein